MFPCTHHVHHPRERLQLQKLLQSHQNSQDSATRQRPESGHPTIFAPNSGGQKSSSEGEKPSPTVGQNTNRPVVSL
ncbi:hypothetical protein M9458_047816, partial [Cirrhinus mrigala]